MATNTLSQGDTREVALDQLIDGKWIIHHAIKSAPWPNEANLEVSKVTLTARAWTTNVELDGRLVNSITSSLDERRRVQGAPSRLSAASSIAFQGSNLLGTGFTMEPEAAVALIRRDPLNAQVLAPFIGGKEVSDEPAHEARRWVINFRNWPLKKAKQFSACFALVEASVKPDRMHLMGRNPIGTKRATFWWHYGADAKALYREIATLDQVVVIVLHSVHAMPVMIDSHQVFSHGLAVFAYCDLAHFGVLASSFHNLWAIARGSSLETRVRYTPSDVFETFAQPLPQTGSLWERVDDSGREVNEFRTDLMIRTGLGLTKTYNRVHDPDDQDPEIVRLRDLHVELDYSVRDAYGWSDLELDHHHWETPQGMRFTVGPRAKDELLDRLLELNHERYAAEVEAGLHDKKSKRASAKPRAKAPDQTQGRIL